MGVAVRWGRGGAVAAGGCGGAGGRRVESWAARRGAHRADLLAQLLLVRLGHRVRLALRVRIAALGRLGHDLVRLVGARHAEDGEAEVGELDVPLRVA